MKRHIQVMIWPKWQDTLTVDSILIAFISPKTEIKKARGPGALTWNQKKLYWSDMLLGCLCNQFDFWPSFYISYVPDFIWTRPLFEQMFWQSLKLRQIRRLTLGQPFQNQERVWYTFFFHLVIPGKPNHLLASRYFIRQFSKSSEKCVI